MNEGVAQMQLSSVKQAGVAPTTPVALLHKVHGKLSTAAYLQPRIAHAGGHRISSRFDTLKASSVCRGNPGEL
jgi:hypothetical protein